jgi:hypothetical protein
LFEADDTSVDCRSAERRVDEEPSDANAPIDADPVILDACWSLSILERAEGGAGNGRCCNASDDETVRDPFPSPEVDGCVP